jgi:hypothetical protein
MLVQVDFIKGTNKGFYLERVTFMICRVVDIEDLEEILKLQYLAYKSEAEIYHDNN